jgi:hypothetical protein
VFQGIQGQAPEALGRGVAVQFGHPAVSDLMDGDGKQQGQDRYRKKLGQA